MLDADGGQLDHIRAEIRQRLAELARLLAGAGDDDALAEQRAFFEPIDLLALLHHAADHRHGGRAEIFALGDVRDVRERADDGFLGTGGGPLGEGDRRLRIGSVFDE